MFINISNHNSAKWSVEQTKAAKKWGNIVDMPFPNIPATWTTAQVETAAQEMARDIDNKFWSGWTGDGAPESITIMVQGEMGFTHAFVNWIREFAPGITVVTACSERVAHETVDENGATHKTVVFDFVQFREFPF